MSENTLMIAEQYPLEQYNVLVPMQTITEVAEIQKPVMNSVQISTNLEDKEIYIQDKAQKAYKNKSGYDVPARPAGYALTKKGLTKLMRAAGIKMRSSRPIVPSVCQKCANMNAAIGKPVKCGACPNKDVKYEVRISVPQLTGEDMEIVAHKEILVDDVVADMTDKQKAEFLKFRNEMCESKALNRALRTALQIKGTYLLEELKKPFVVAYLVPNLDHPDVKAEAVKHFFGAASGVYENRPTKTRNTVFVDDDSDEGDGYEAPTEPVGMPHGTIESDSTGGPGWDIEDATLPWDLIICEECGSEITSTKGKGGKIWEPEDIKGYSEKEYGRCLCPGCQVEERGAK